MAGTKVELAAASVNFIAAWTIVEPVNVQFYPKGGGGKAIPTERVSARRPNAARHLFFVTYLNDIRDGGGTEFPYRKMIVAAREGLTSIRPADWTQTHPGVVSPSEAKFVMTGWFTFV